VSFIIPENFIFISFKNFVELRQIFSLYLDEIIPFSAECPDADNVWMVFYECIKLFEFLLIKIPEGKRDISKNMKPQFSGSSTVVNCLMMPFSFRRSIRYFIAS